MQETQVRSLGPEDPLEKGMATHSGSLPWRIPWTEETGRLYIVHEVTESDMPQQLTQLSFSLLFPKEYAVWFQLVQEGIVFKFFTNFILISTNKVLNMH